MSVCTEFLTEVYVHGSRNFPGGYKAILSEDFQPARNARTANKTGTLYLILSALQESDRVPKLKI